MKKVWNDQEAIKGLTITAIIGGIITLVLLAFTAWTLWSWKQVAIHNHNLDVFYKSLTCDDLPLGSDTDVEECEQAIGEFMLKERGLFTK